MQKGFLPSMMFCALAALTAFQSCKKESALGIDNDRVIKIPYSFYAADSAGRLINSTDGAHFFTIFPPDGYAPQLILTSGPNLLIVKQNLHMSENDGRNFNVVYSQLRKFPWQTMAYDFPLQNRIYITSQEGKGISFSDDHGKTWQVDSLWDNNVPSEFEISSFSGLADNSMYAYSNESNVLFRKDGRDGAWTAVVMEGLFPVDGSSYFLTSNDKTLFLTDHAGIGGVWYSEDEGVHWTRFTQGALPMNIAYNCALSTEGGTSLLIETDTAGIYRVENGGFVAASGGLEINTSAYSFCYKKNIYKNNVTKPYTYAGTDKGIYISENNGRTWDKITFGIWDGKYVATY